MIARERKGRWNEVDSVLLCENVEANVGTYREITHARKERNEVDGRKDGLVRNHPDRDLEPRRSRNLDLVQYLIPLASSRPKDHFHSQPSPK